MARKLWGPILQKNYSEGGWGGETLASLNSVCSYLAFLLGVKRSPSHRGGSGGGCAGGCRRVGIGRGGR